MSVGFITVLALLIDGTGSLTTLLQALGVEASLRAFLPNALLIVQRVAAGALIIGLLNLVAVHGLKLARVRRYGFNALGGLLLVVCAFGVIFLTVLESQGQLSVPAGEPSYTAVLRNTVQFSVEASLAGLLAFSLIYGAFRFLRRGVSLSGVIFLAALVANLLFQAQLPAPRWLTQLQESIVNAGADGVLLGIALATLVAGVRVLIGQDRSYRE